MLPHSSPEIIRNVIQTKLNTSETEVCVLGVTQIQYKKARPEWFSSGLGGVRFQNFNWVRIRSDLEASTSSS